MHSDYSADQAQKITIRSDRSISHAPTPLYCSAHFSDPIVINDDLPRPGRFFPVPSTKALREVYSTMPRSRIALENRTHSPWISRLLTEPGHECECDERAQSTEGRRKDDRLDAQPLARLATPSELG